MAGESCSHNCSGCGEDCGDREQESLFEKLNSHSSVKKVIGVVSGKGGVGKSSMTALLSLLKQREGKKVAILDGDITGPSIGRVFGVENQQLLSNGEEIIPVTSQAGTKIVSANLMLETTDTPVIWRGPVLAGLIKQFWSDVAWGDIDYMFVDMPPGTGDVPLTIFQSLPLDGIIIVTSPQELVGMIVGKAVNMAKQMNIPIIGLVENMSYVRCPDCDKKIYVFGKSHSQEIAHQYDLNLLGQLPLDSELTQLSDLGRIEDFYASWLEDFSKNIKDI